MGNNHISLTKPTENISESVKLVTQNIYVLRHGQTDLNLQGKFQGRIDTELNDTGIKQVQKSKIDLEKIDFDLVFVSPLKRAKDTAKIVTDKELIIDNRLIERSFGKLEGALSVPDYEEKRDFYEVEHLEDVKKRVDSFLNEIKEKYKDKENILIVTHEAIAQNINAYFYKNDDIKSFRLKTGDYTIYKIIDKEKLMKNLEEIELSRKLLDVKPQKLTKIYDRKEKLHIVYLMVWTKVCGGSKIILEYANRLAKKGHKITLLSYDEKPTWFNLNEKIEFIQIPEGELIENSVPDCDLIIPTSWKNIYQAIVSQKAPVTFFEQGGSHVFEVQNLSKLKYATVIRRMELVPFIHTVSSYSKDKIKEFYGKDSEVICNAIESKIFYPRSNFDITDNNINITIIGSEGFKFKNINETLEAIRILKKKYNNINLNWITQDTPKMNKEKAIVNPKQIEIGNILRKTDIFICNSEYESFCLPALEAMACGAAVITTDNGGIRDFVKDGYNALIIQKHNLDDLTEKIELLINDTEKRIQLMKNGIETSNKFSWEKSVDKIENYYRNIAQYKIDK